MRKLLRIFLLFFFMAICDTCLPAGPPAGRAGMVRYAICETLVQDTDKLTILSKQVMEAKTTEAAQPILGELADLYFKEHKYNEFVDFLKSLISQKKTLGPTLEYYVGYTRYTQLKYLEETQEWDEYFSQGNIYREELVTFLEKAIEVLHSSEPFSVYARLTRWKFHKDQQDAFHEAALTDLINATLIYAKTATKLKPIADTADALFLYDEKAKAKQIYKVYGEILVASDIGDAALEIIAKDFYQKGNLELAEEIYTLYRGRIKSKPKEKIIPLLFEIAKDFAYKDEGLNDPFYAEEVFGEIEELAGKDVLNEEQIYLRAFNLEKAKEYSAARNEYLYLVERYPESAYADQVNFKIAVIFAYALRDIKNARDYLLKLSAKETLSPQAISSLYQLGLLSQWENDTAKAKEYYNRLLEIAKDDFSDSVELAKERIKEIDAAKPLDYNLKTFLDVSFKEEYATLEMTKIDLKSHPYILKKNENIAIAATTHLAESGCLQVEIQYLWSGHTGKIKPTSEQPSFNTTYHQTGTKEINLVVVSPTGIIDRSIDLVDVH